MVLFPLLHFCRSDEHHVIFKLQPSIVPCRKWSKSGLLRQWGLENGQRMFQIKIDRLAKYACATDNDTQETLRKVQLVRTWLTLTINISLEVCNMYMSIFISFRYLESNWKRDWPFICSCLELKQWVVDWIKHTTKQIWTAKIYFTDYLSLHSDLRRNFCALDS